MYNYILKLLFVECLTPEGGSVPSDKYILAKGTVVYFKPNENMANCNQQMLFSIITNLTQTGDMLGYIPSEVLASRLSYKVVQARDFLYCSKDLTHLDGLIISLRNSK